MSRHERGFLRICRCSDCDGTGRMEMGVRGPNDPQVRQVICPECEGVGEVAVEALDDVEDE